MEEGILPYHTLLEILVQDPVTLLLSGEVGTAWQGHQEQNHLCPRPGRKRERERGQVCWHTPVIPVLEEAEPRGSEAQGKPRLDMRPVSPPPEAPLPSDSAVLGTKPSTGHF